MQHSVRVPVAFLDQLRTIILILRHLSRRQPHRDQLGSVRTTPSACPN